MEKIAIEKELFKTVIGDLIDETHLVLTDEEVLRVAMGAVSAFAKNHTLRLIWEIK